MGVYGEIKVRKVAKLARIVKHNSRVAPARTIGWTNGWALDPLAILIVQPLDERPKTRYDTCMKNELTVTAASLTPADYDWYETNRHAAETFGLANAFEDREDRNRYRRIERALKPVPAKVKALKVATLADLPAGVIGVEVPVARFSELPDGVREVADEVARLWAASNQPVAFSGVGYGADKRSGKLTWWVSGDLFDPAVAPGLPPMYTANGKRCRAMKAPRPNGHRYHTASLRTVLYRLRRGADLFAAG